jgi:hypothetical protein
MSGEKAVQDRTAGRGITHPKGGVAVLAGAESAEGWGDPAGRACVQSLTAWGAAPVTKGKSARQGCPCSVAQGIVTGWPRRGTRLGEPRHRGE